MKSIKMFGKSVPLLAIVVISLLAIGASATLLTYYGSIGGTVVVKQAVLVDDKGVGTPIVENFGDEVRGGDTVCTLHKLENMATIPAPVSFGTTYDPTQDGIIVKYLAPIEYSFTATVGEQPVDIDVTDDGTSITWTIDYPMEAPYDPLVMDGQFTVGLVIALDGVEPVFQIHNNDGTDATYAWGTWLMSPWDTTIPGNWEGWVSGFVNTPVTDPSLDWVECTGDKYYANNPDGIFTITIDKTKLGDGLCDTDFHWALNLAIGSGFSSQYYTYEQMACPEGIPYFDWANPLVMSNYEYATLAEEITGVILEPSEIFDFMICYTFPIHMSGAYIITSTVDVAIP